MDKQKMLYRMSIVLTYKQPFTDWVNSLKTHDGEKDDFSGLYATYLISDVSRAYKTLIRKYANRIFRNELSQFCMDRTLWPENINYELLNKWFTLSVADWVYEISGDDVCDYETCECDICEIQVFNCFHKSQKHTQVKVRQEMLEAVEA